MGAVGWHRRCATCTCVNVRALIAIAAFAALPFSIAPRAWPADGVEQIGNGVPAAQLSSGWVVEGRAAAHRHVSPAPHLVAGLVRDTHPTVVAAPSGAPVQRGAGPCLADRPRVVTMPTAGPPAGRWVPIAVV